VVFPHVHINVAQYGDTRQNILYQEKDIGTDGVSTLIQNDITHYIFENQGMVTATWALDRFECMIVGNISISEMEKCIASIQRLSLDMFVPSKKFAIEYQGRQHYEPIEFFGGEAAFIEQIKRDELKKQLCKENGVKLIYWPYNQLIANEELLNEIEKL